MQTELKPAAFLTSSHLSPLVEELRQREYVVFEPGEPNEPQETLLARYARAASDPRIDRSKIALIGFGPSADMIAREYFRFYARQSPLAGVLLSTSADVADLNKMTCPYFLVHGEKDPLWADRDYKSFQNAVHHHEMRYGDVTTRYLFPRLGHDLSKNGSLDREVVNEVLYWLSEVLREPRRPQERAAAPAA